MPPPAPAAAKPSEDPVLADLESDLPTPPVFTAYTQPKKTSGSLWALLAMMIIGGGLYAAWMYQPGFREWAQPQIDRVIAMAMTGQVKAPQATSQPAAAAAPAPVSAKPAETQPAPAAAASTDSAATSTTLTGSAATSSAAPESTSTTPIPAPAAAPPEKAVTDTARPQPTVDSKKEVLSAPSDAELPGEKTAIILSSQGAEKRLMQHHPPAYPAEARKAGIEGTVVLKTVVNESGKVQGVRLVEGNPALATAAISSVKQWHYRPYVRDGKARPFQTIVLVEFQRP